VGEEGVGKLYTHLGQLQTESEPIVSGLIDRQARLAALVGLCGPNRCLGRDVFVRLSGYYRGAIQCLERGSFWPYTTLQFRNEVGSLAATIASPPIVENDKIAGGGCLEGDLNGFKLRNC
jgi:hypothetical protein